MINYSDWNLTDDHSYNVYCALEYCRKHNEDGIYFPKAHYDFYGDTRAVDTQIKRIRQKLPAEGTVNWSIKTVYGVGYKFEVSR